MGCSDLSHMNQHHCNPNEYKGEQIEQRKRLPQEHHKSKHVQKEVSPERKADIGKRKIGQQRLSQQQLKLVPKGRVLREQSAFVMVMCFIAEVVFLFHLPSILPLISQRDPPHV